MNCRHRKVGHLFQVRFKAFLVDGDAYLMEVCSYVELNPVRARMVTGPGGLALVQLSGARGRGRPPTVATPAEAVVFIKA